MAEYEFGLKCDDGTYHEETAIWSYYQQVNTAAEKYGRPLQVAHTLGPLIQNAGFVDLVHMTRKLALGCWPKLQKHKEIGRWFQMVCQTGFEAYGLQSEASVWAGGLPCTKLTKHIGFPLLCSRESRAKALTKSKSSSELLRRRLLLEVYTHII